MFKIQYRAAREAWQFSMAADRCGAWDCDISAHSSFVDTIKRWPNLSHRIVRVDDDGEPLEVLMVYDVSRYSIQGEL